MFVTQLDSFTFVRSTAFLLFSYAARLCTVSNNSVQSSYLLKYCIHLSGFLPSAFYKHNKGRRILMQKCGKLKRRMVCVMLLPLLTFAQWSLLIGILLVKLITCLPSSRKYRRFTNQPGMEIYMHKFWFMTQYIKTAYTIFSITISLQSIKGNNNNI